MACGDAHLVGVELYRPVLAEIVGEQHTELVEQFVLVLADVLPSRCVVCLAHVLYVQQQRIDGKNHVLSAIVSVVVVAGSFNVKDVYLAENVVQELLLKVAVASLMWAAFHSLYGLGAHGTACCKPSVL